MTRTVVVAPHPDDEVLGCSGVLFDSSSTVIHVTDGVPPWTASTARDGLRVTRRTECTRAWESLSSRVECIALGFGDLVAWQSVDDICDSLHAVIGSLGPARIYLPAYQRGHPDHDATYLAGAMVRERLTGDANLEWLVYGLYGFDRTRRLRFGWLTPETYDPVDAASVSASMLDIKGCALRQFTSQVWPGSALDLWLRGPAREQFAPLPERWEAWADLPCFYDEELGFGRYGASVGTVEATFQRVLATRAG
jgi:LmbE family N-acetylglucosaminyl deacetylase